MKEILTFKNWIHESSESTPKLSKKITKWLDLCSDGSWNIDSASGKINIKGNFSAQQGFEPEFFETEFEEVSGNFDCSNLSLTSLKGSPRKVGGSFICSNNQLTSLADGPIEVFDHYDCSYNKLTSLEGSPRKVGRAFICSNNQLTSLAGAPDEVGKNFNCKNNPLTTAEDAPKIIGGDFISDGIKYKNSETKPKSSLSKEAVKWLGLCAAGTWRINNSTGKVDIFGNFPHTRKVKVQGTFPVEFGEIDGNFDCSDLGLTSLKGAPSKVKGSFICSDNKITSLEGAPAEILGNFFCKKTRIVTLEGGPKKVHGSFVCNFNPDLISLKGAPLEIGRTFRCRYFELKGDKKWNTENLLEIIFEKYPEDDEIKKFIVPALDNLGLVKALEADPRVIDLIDPDRYEGIDKVSDYSVELLKSLKMSSEFSLI